MVAVCISLGVCHSDLFFISYSASPVRHHEKQHLISIAIRHSSSHFPYNSIALSCRIINFEIGKKKRKKDVWSGSCFFSFLSSSSSSSLAGFDLSLTDCLNDSSQWCRDIYCDSSFINFLDRNSNHPSTSLFPLLSLFLALFLFLFLFFYYSSISCNVVAPPENNNNKNNNNDNNNNNNNNNNNDNNKKKLIFRGTIHKKSKRTQVLYEHLAIAMFHFCINAFDTADKHRAINSPWMHICTHQPTYRRCCHRPSETVICRCRNMANKSALAALLLLFFFFFQGGWVLILSFIQRQFLIK